MMDKPLVMVVVSETTSDITHGKFLFGAEMLRRAGMDVLVFTWHETAFRLAKEKNFFAATPQLDNLPMTNDRRIELSKQAWGLLDWPISEQREAPTWARLLALDDVLGAVQEFRSGNLDVLKPDVIVKACQGAESSTPADEQMDLLLGRWATRRGIPVVAIEVQRADDVLALKWPVQVLLTKQPLLAVPYAAETWQLPAAERYIATMGIDPSMETYLEKGTTFRDQFQLAGRRMVFLPFHLYYTQECMKTLTELGRVIWDLTNWRVVVGCGEAFRRSYKERDIVDKGLVRGWKGLGDIVIAENVDPVAAMLSADVVAPSYKSSTVQEFTRRWDLTTWEVGQDWKEVVSKVQRVRGLVEAVRGVLPQQAEMREAA